MSARTILIVDDSADARAILCEALKLDGYRVIQASDGKQAVRLYREQSPVLVLLDHDADKGEIDTTKEILALNPDAWIFTISGAGQYYQAVAGLLAGKHRLAEPLGIGDDLLVAVAQALRKLGARFEKVYREGFRLTLKDDGLVIEALDYHTRPLLLDRAQLAALGLKLKKRNSD